MERSADSSACANSRFHKYGGELELYMFSKVYQRSVWVLQKQSTSKEFRWSLESKPINATATNRIDQDAMLLYTRDRFDDKASHYDAVISRRVLFKTKRGMQIYVRTRKG